MKIETTTLQIFNNSSFGEIRTVFAKQESWFAAVDTCKVLEISNTTQAVQRLDDDERCMFNIGRQGEAWFVNEFGLYNLILRSRKQEAKAFKRWITHEVLPSIRKTGTFQMRQLTKDQSKLALQERLLAKEQSKLATQEAAVARANIRISANALKIAEELNKSIRINDQFQISAIIGMCEAQGIELPAFDYGCGFDMGDEKPTPAVEQSEDGTFHIHMRELVEINGVSKPLEYWCRRIKLDRNGLRYRLRSGQTLEQALTQKSNRH